MKVKSKSLNRPSPSWSKNYIRPRDVYCTEIDFPLQDYQIVGYAQGSGIKQCSTLTWEHFDSITPMHDSKNPINGIHAMWFNCIRFSDKFTTRRMHTVVAVKIK